MMFRKSRTASLNRSGQLSVRRLDHLTQQRQQTGHPHGGWTITPETEKIVVEKWCYFLELYKMTKVLEDRIENV